VPTVETVAELVRTGWRDEPSPIVLGGVAEKYDAFAASTAALAASGTVALELAMAGLPMAVTYRVNQLTAWLVRRVVRVLYVNLINLILDRPGATDWRGYFFNPWTGRVERPRSRLLAWPRGVLVRRFLARLVDGR
jgi:lipid-A-disaccharide synthase